MAEIRLFLPPFPLFNAAVVLSRTSRYMLTYYIDLGDGGEGEWPYRTHRYLLVVKIFKNFEKYIRKCPNNGVQDCRCEGHTSAYGLCTGNVKKGAGNDKQRKDAGNRTLCPCRNFSQAIRQYT